VPAQLSGGNLELPEVFCQPSGVNYQFPRGKKELLNAIWQLLDAIQQRSGHF
jgi:hypothetical protein